MVFPDGRRRSFGTGAPSFTLTLRDGRAMRAIASMDEGRVGDAYVAGHIDIEGRHAAALRDPPIDGGSSTTR